MRGCRREAQLVIVDDQPMNVHLLRRILAKAGYENVHGFTDPRAALESEVLDQADLVVLDLHMPSMNGLDVLSTLRDRQDPAGVPVPILVLTADYSTEPRQRALAAGADDYVTKPFDQAEVLQRIANLLETRFLALELRSERERLEAAALRCIADLTLFKDVLDALPDAVVIQAHDTGRIIYANHAAGRLLGRGSRQAGNRPSVRVMPARHASSSTAAVPALAAPGPGASGPGAAGPGASGPGARSALVAEPIPLRATNGAPESRDRIDLDPVPFGVAVQVLRTGLGDPVVVSLVRREPREPPPL